VDNLLGMISEWIIQNPALTDIIIGAGIIIQGELTILAAVYLVVNDSLTWAQYVIPAVLTLVVGETLVYIFGRVIRNTRFGWKFHTKIKNNKRLQTYTYYLKKNMGRLLIIAKFLPATNFIILLLIGWSKTKLGQFLKSYLTSVLFWFTIMTALAYFLMSGLSYLRTEKVLHQAEIGIVVVLLLILIGEHFLRKAFRKYSEINQKIESIGELMEKKTEEEK